MANRLLIILLAAFLSSSARSQDILPVRAQRALPTPLSKSIRAITLHRDSIAMPVAIPPTFAGIADNRIIDSSLSLAPLFGKLRLLRAGLSEDTVRIVHIGDSHVRGHIFPQTAGAKLQEVFGALSYCDMGINGATCATYAQPDRIAAVASQNPELLIVSFGTNECYGKRYSAAQHYEQLDHLVRELQQALPSTPILLTTPPGSYERTRLRRRKYKYSLNPRMHTAVATICRYAATNHLAVWDLYDIVGGDSHACQNWTAANLMRPDHVHFFAEGYVLQGELLASAIINNYSRYELP
jgi:lysophospholipase L1-like esterase